MFHGRYGNLVTDMLTDVKCKFNQETVEKNAWIKALKKLDV